MSQWSLPIARGYKTLVVTDDTDSVLRNITVQLPEAAQSDHVDEMPGGDKPAGKGQNTSLRPRFGQGLAVLHGPSPSCVADVQFWIRLLT